MLGSLTLIRSFVNVKKSLYVLSFENFHVTQIEHGFQGQINEAS